MFKRNKVKGDSDFQVYIFVQILRHSLNKKMVWKGLICVCHHYEAEGYVIKHKSGGELDTPSK